jgi:hypothetical protein
MRLGRYLTGVLFVVPPYDRNVGEKLIGIIKMTMIVVEPDLKLERRC